MWEHTAGGSSPRPRSEKHVERAVCKLRAKGGIKVSRAAGGEGRLCSVFWVGEQYVKVCRENPVVFKKLNKISELRAWGVKRVLSDWAGNNKDRNQAVENVCHMTEFG